MVKVMSPSASALRIVSDRSKETMLIRRVRAAMRGAGFAMREEGDSYNDDTDQTLVAWTWVCWEDDG